MPVPGARAVPRRRRAILLRPRRRHSGSRRKGCAAAISSPSSARPAAASLRWFSRVFFRRCARSGEKDLGFRLAQPRRLAAARARRRIRVRRRDAPRPARRGSRQLPRRASPSERRWPEAEAPSRTALSRREREARLVARSVAPAADHQAEQAYAASLAIRKALFDEDPKNAERRRDLGLSYEHSGWQAADSNESLRALELFEANVKLREEAQREAPNDAQAQRDLANAYDFLGLALRPLGRPNDALARGKVLDRARGPSASDRPFPCRA